MDNEEREAAKKLAKELGTLLAIIFVIPVWCMLAWNSWAWEFNLPQFGYWHWVVTMLAIRTVCGNIQHKNNEEGK